MNEYGVKLDKKRRPCMFKEKEIQYPGRLSSPEEIVQMMNEVFDMQDLAEEHVYMLTMNTRNRVTGLFQVGHGYVDGCTVSPRDILTRALLAGAARIVILHNHPSGDPTFSREDEACTIRLAKACSIVGIGLLDHIVVGYGSFMSVRNDAPHILDVHV